MDSYVHNLAAITADRERIAAELDVASRIQAIMLPEKEICCFYVQTA